MLGTILNGAYPIFFVVALPVIIWRMHMKYWTRQETLLLTFALVHTIGEILQVLLGDGKFDFSSRYLLPVAPIFFIWTGYGVVQGVTFLRKYLSLLIIVSLFVLGSLALVYDGVAHSLKKIYGSKQARTQVAETAGILIQNHYKGPQQDRPPVHRTMYRSPYLPVVWCKYHATALFAGGRAEPSPFEETAHYYVLSAEEKQQKLGQYDAKIADFTVGDKHYEIFKNDDIEKY